MGYAVHVHHLLTAAAAGTLQTDRDVSEVLTCALTSSWAAHNPTGVITTPFEGVPVMELIQLILEGQVHQHDPRHVGDGGVRDVSRLPSTA